MWHWLEPWALAFSWCALWLVRRKKKRVLIITSSGGGGLLQAANAKEQELKASNPGTVVILRDVMKDWMWKPTGKFFVGLWNQAQKKGNVRAQALLGAGAPI